MPTVLIISRSFPPAGPAGACIRVTKFMKAAIRQGWNFAVLTQDPDRPVVPEKPLCGFLLDELPADLRVVRVANPFWGQGLFSRMGRWLAGDSSLPWGIRSIRAGYSLLRDLKVDLIFVNTPPFTNVAIGAVLSRIFRLPLAVDFKDDWVGSFAFSKKNRLRRTLESRIEKWIIDISSAVFVVTPASYDLYTQRYPDRDKFHLIPNGQDFEEYQVLSGRSCQIETEKFTILTAAAGYRSNYRDLTHFLRALEIFLRDHPTAREHMDIVFLGDAPAEEYTCEIQRLGLTRNIHHIDAVDRRELVEWLWKSDLFFLIQPRENFTAISGTLYEYWATGKAPILLISEKGASSDVVEKHHIGEHFYFDQTREIAVYLERIYTAYQNRRPIWINRAGVEQHDRKMLADKMIACWKKILSQNGVGQ